MGVSPTDGKHFASADKMDLGCLVVALDDDADSPERHDDGAMRLHELLWIEAIDQFLGFYPVSTDCWVKSLKARSLASSLRWMSGLWNRSM